MRQSKVVRVFTPGSIGNVGPGLDVLGLAVGGAGDTVTVELTDSGSIEVVEAGHPTLSHEPDRHASAIAAAAVLRIAKRRAGLRIWLKKGLPLSGGQGGSAASAVAGAYAANLLLGSPLDSNGLMAAALASESVLAGRHLDNIAPSLLGGLTLIRSLDPIDVVRLAVPAKLRIVLVKPSYELRTKDGRAVLPASIDRATALHQAAQVAGILAGAATGNLALIGRSIDDRIAEPVRASLLPGFVEAKRAALRAGGLGCSISGSGPTMFVFAADNTTAQRVGRAVVRSYGRSGFGAEVRIAGVDTRGTRRLRADGWR